MKNRVFLKFLWVVTVAVTACFTTAYGMPQVEINVVLISVSGDTTVLVPGDNASSLNAPLRAVFRASLTTDDGKEYVMFPEWTVTRIVTDGGAAESRRALQSMSLRITASSRLILHGHTGRRILPRLFPAIPRVP